MNDETREVLGAVQEMFFGLKQDMTEVKERVCKIEDSQTDLSKRIIKMEETQRDLKLLIENTTNKNINLLVEGHMQNAAKLDKLHEITEDLEVAKFDIDIIKKVVTTHSSEINKLGRAK